MIIKIIVIAFISIFISSSIKKYSPEFSNLINVTGGVIIFLICIDEIAKIITYFSEIYNLIEIDNEFFTLIFKII